MTRSRTPRSPSLSTLADPQQPADLLLYRIAKLAATSARLVNRLCEREHGITRREWGVLMWLAQEPGMQPSTLAERLELDRARISRAIGSLAGKGLVERLPAQANRREARLQLSPAGVHMHAALWPRIRAINVQLLEGMSGAQVAALDQQLHTLLEHAQHLDRPGSAEENFPARSQGKRSPGSLGLLRPEP